MLFAVCRTFPEYTPRRATLSFQGAVVTAHPDLFNHSSCNFTTSEFALKTKVKVFPNPFSNNLQIESEVPLQKMALFDVLGKEIFNQNFVNQIDTSNLPKGMYFLKLYTFEGESVVKKVVKEEVNLMVRLLDF